jgi:hypothetical protein
MRAGLPVYEGYFGEVGWHGSAWLCAWLCVVGARCVYVWMCVR